MLYLGFSPESLTSRCQDRLIAIVRPVEASSPPPVAGLPQEMLFENPRCAARSSTAEWLESHRCAGGRARPRADWPENSQPWLPAAGCSAPDLARPRHRQSTATTVPGAQIEAFQCFSPVRGSVEIAKADQCLIPPQRG